MNREDIIQLINKLQVNYYYYDENEMFDICCKLREYITQTTLDSDVEELLYKLGKLELKYTTNNKHDLVNSSYQFNKLKQHIAQLTKSNEEYKAEQNLFTIANRKLQKRIKELEGTHIKDKLKNCESFYTNDNGVGMVKVLASKYYDMDSKLERISEVLENHSDLSNLANYQIQSILKENNNE